MNQMMGSAATSMSTVFSKKIDISPPEVDLLDVKEGEGTDHIPEEDPLVKVSFRLKVGKLIDSHIMQLYPLTFAKDLIDELTNQDSGEQPVQTEEAPPVQEKAAASAAPTPTPSPKKSLLLSGREQQRCLSLFRSHLLSLPHLILRQKHSRISIILTCSWTFLYR